MKNTTNAADFNAKLAALIDAANNAEPKSNDAYTADAAIKQLFWDEAVALQRKYNRLPKDFALIIQTQWLTHPGEVWKSDMEIGITTIGDIDTFPTEVRFAFNGYDYRYGHRKIFARYRTPTQVEAVIRMIKAAVKRGDTEFKFPTIEQAERAAE